MAKSKNNKSDKNSGGSSQSRKYVTRSIKQRMLITVVLMACGFSIIVTSLANIALVKHDEYSAMASNQQLRDTVVAAPRGTIYDANMNVLARSATVWTVALSPMDIDKEDYDTIARGLADILEVDYQTVYDKCSEKTYYSIVKRKVDQPVIDEIRAFMSENKVGGISFTEDSKRYYPYGNFLAQVLGFVGTDNQGLSGLEAYYDDVLSGTSGRVLTAKNARGSDMYYEYETRYEPQAGHSLVLTVDEVIQHYLEKNLEAAIEQHNIQNNAMGIIMNVKTGEIYAMAVKPDFDPNDPLTVFDEKAAAALAELEGTEEYSAQLGLAQNKQWRNSTISDLYEPGSVFKVVTASTALETGAATLDSSYYCAGYKQVLTWRMNCAQAGGHGQQDFTHAVINSCNPAFIEIGQSIGIDTFCSYIRAFGLNEKTGIDLPGEANSIVYDGVVNKMNSIVELSSCAFGQSNKITPLQMITAMSAVVNGGYLVQPHIVKEIIDEDGNIIQSFDTTVKRQVLSAETSATMCGILERVVVEGNSQNAYVAGYRLGGKSGTAQDLTSSEVGKYWASFCAFAPADDPEIACLVIYDNARSSTSIYGGTIVAPVVASIMKDVLPYIGVDPIYSESELESLDVVTPSVTGMLLTSAYSYLQPEGLDYTVIGDGTTVVSQFPGGGQSIPRGSKVILYTDEREVQTVQVPNLVGSTQSAAAATLQAYGLNVKVNGSASPGASVMGQNIAEGETVPTGTVVTIECVQTTND